MVVLCCFSIVILVNLLANLPTFTVTEAACTLPTSATLAARRRNEETKEELRDLNFLPGWFGGLEDFSSIYCIYYIV